ncbi:beta strand repeat-containing protein [Variovorax sp. ZT5P49]|uniref:beta strand repeat-containing protein n=1 Tax=Variovorax sp. ZT5P49 TaxID=3443733 RepID=UPI003F45417D
MRPNFRRRLLPMAAAALCAAAAAAPLPLWAQPLPGALPTGWSVTSGNVSFTQNGTTLNILQGTPQALVNFATFNVGANALVDIRQPGSTSALLARTVGGDPSLIYGQIKANGALWLINPAGIMVGPGARIDVGSFIASTLNVSDSDFLAGRLMFRGTASAGEVRNAGTINAASGGSIYLVGPSVVNSGTLNAPNGEVLLAAGQTVQLVDTGTPGVSVAITGTPGEAKNLGRIAAEAGRIGLAAGLVTNSGSINADSVVREGGRVFLRASGDLKTTAASDISANGTTGGNVVLYADGAAAIDGRVSATGSAGRGGYVDTSGQRSLDVVNVPIVGRGGEWHIDPLSIEIVAGGGSGGTTGTNAITSSETGAHIGADIITSQLDAGTDVSITTGSPTTGAGDITVSSAIARTSAADSTLTLNASNNIVINAAITSKGGKLGLNLNSNLQNDDSGASHAAQVNADMNLNGGVLTVSEGSSTTGNGTLIIGGGTTSLAAPTSAIVAGTVNVGAGGTLLVQREGSPISGVLNNAGTVSIDSPGTVSFGQGGTHSGVFNVSAPSTLSMSGGQTFNAGSGFTGTGTVAWSDAVTLGTNLSFSQGGNSLVLHDMSLNTGGNTLLTQGAGVVVDGAVTLREAGVWRNSAAVEVRGSSGAILAHDERVKFENDGTVTTTGTRSDVFAGTGGVMATFINNGTLVKATASDQQFTGIQNGAAGTIRADAGRLTLASSTLGGKMQVASGAQLTLDNVTLDSSTDFSGAGAMTWQNYISLLGAVDVKAAAPVLSMGASTAIQGQGNTLTTRNVVNMAGSEVTLAAVTWNNLGTLNLGDGAAFTAGDGRLANGGTVVKTGTGLVAVPLSNMAGGTVRIEGGTLDARQGTDNPNNGAIVLQAGATLGGGGADIYNNGSISGSGTIALGGDGTLVNNGIVSPGTATTAGTLTVRGNYTQTGSGTLNIKVGGSGFDLLDIDGSAHLAGALNLAGLGGALPANGAQADFVVARGLSNSGTFSQVNAPAQTSPGSTATLTVSYPTGGSSVARATAAVVPTLGACTTNPALPGCDAVLPTLTQCVANRSLDGCSAVLPTAAACTVSPTMLGCEAPPTTTTPVTSTPPSADICTIAPNSALCQVLSPPTASEPVKPVQQATNEIIKTVTWSSSGGALFFTSSTSSSDDKTSDTKSDKAADKTDTKEVASADKVATKNEPAKKMYCN